MPAGQVDTKFNADLSMFLNQRFTCMVTKVDREDQNIILSRRELLEQEEAKEGERTWASWRWGRFAKARSHRAALWRVCEHRRRGWIVARLGHEPHAGERPAQDRERGR